MDPVLPARSCLEAYLYSMVTACPACTSGPLMAQSVRTDGPELVISGVCRACGQTRDLAFHITCDTDPELFSCALEDLCTRPLPPLAPDGGRSEIIDVPGWLTLYSVIAGRAKAFQEKAATIADRACARQMQILAACCIEEAMRFYRERDELPVPSAFFGDRSRKQFRERPELFTRSRLIELRRALPTQCR